MTESDIRQLVRESVISEKMRSVRAWSGSQPLWWIEERYYDKDKSKGSDDELLNEKNAMDCYFCSSSDPTFTCSDNTGWSEVNAEFKSNIDELIAMTELSSFNLALSSTPWRTRYNQTGLVQDGTTKAKWSWHMNVEEVGSGWTRSSKAVDMKPGAGALKDLHTALKSPAVKTKASRLGIEIVTYKLEDKKHIHFEPKGVSGSIKRHYEKAAKFIIKWAGKKGNCKDVEVYNKNKKSKLPGRGGSSGPKPSV